VERLRGNQLLGRLRMMDLGTSVIKSWTPGGPGCNTVRTAVPDIAGSLVMNLLNFTIRALRILRWLLYFLWMEVAQDHGK